MRQDQYQNVWDDPVRNHAAGFIGVLGGKGGYWPGAEASWGSERIWLEPAQGTETFGRSGFSIHGGWEPGSAGCVDLTSSMEAFAERFRAHGRDVVLHVRYERQD